MTGRGVCWDILQAMLAKDPAQRITASVALSLVLEARRRAAADSDSDSDFLSAS